MSNSVLFLRETCSGPCYRGAASLVGVAELASATSASSARHGRTQYSDVVHVHMCRSGGDPVVRWVNVFISANRKAEMQKFVLFRILQEKCRIPRNGRTLWTGPGQLTKTRAGPQSCQSGDNQRLITFISIDLPF